MLKVPWVIFHGIHIVSLARFFVNLQCRSIIYLHFLPFPSIPFVLFHFQSFPFNPCISFHFLSLYFASFFFFSFHVLSLSFISFKSLPFRFISLHFGTHSRPNRSRTLRPGRLRNFESHLTIKVAKLILSNTNHCPNKHWKSTATWLRKPIPK